MKKLLILGLFALCLLLSACGEAGEKPATHEPSEAPASAESISTPEEPSVTDEKIAAMSLEEKAWQLMYVYPEHISGELCCVDADVWAVALDEKPAGGIVFVSDNFPSEEKTRAMMEAIVSADRGLFLGLDEEGGKVARLSYALGVTTDFEPMYEYREGGRLTAFKNARTIALDIASFGFNMDFAPVADVWTNELNTVIARRAYSREPQEAAILVSAAVAGFHEGGVISVLKHFPGHGDTKEDSHYFTAHTDKTIEELRECEFLPFVSGIAAGADAVMVGHIVAEEIDPDNPATLSKAVIDLLRNELGFEGLIITDAFNMEGLGDMPEDEAAAKAIMAGCDMILAPSDPEAAVKAVMENVPEKRIDEALRKVLELKFERGIM